MYDDLGIEKACLIVSPPKFYPTITLSVSVTCYA